MFIFTQAKTHTQKTTPNQPCGLCCADEELRAVGVGTGVGHGQDAGARVLQSEVLVRKFHAIDGLSTSSVVVCEVATLQMFSV